MPFSARKKLASGNPVTIYVTASEWGRSTEMLIRIQYEQSPSEQDRIEANEIVQKVATMAGWEES